MNFVEAMDTQTSWKKTENGLDARNTTFDECLNLFSTIGALRNRNDSEIETKFLSAYNESPLTALKMLFYARDIDEGLGERHVFRVGLRTFATYHTEDIRANLKNIALFGRWDDLYELVGTPLEADVFKLMKDQLLEDAANCAANKPVSLLAKWLKSVNSSSPATRELGRKTAKAFGLSEKKYRQVLSKLRSYINVLEKQMTRNKWSKIDFNEVPGGAMKKYCGAFYRHEEERYREYLDALKSGKTIQVDGKEVKAKINTKHLFPYEILEKYSHNSWGFYLEHVDYNPAFEAMWNGLNDWLQGVQSNTVIVADTSGSMAGRPMATSVGLGIYFAERNSGPFHNRFMTFSSRPSWITLQDNSTLAEKINRVPDICDNTNIEAAFDLILDTAVQNHISQEEMPKNLVIITDMEFDNCVVDNSSYRNRYNHSPSRMDFYDKMKIKYANYGYELPEIVFWNVDARQDTFHATAHKPHVRMVSGQSTSIFKSLIDGKTHTPYDFMLEVLYKERYASVVKAD